MSYKYTYQTQKGQQNSQSTLDWNSFLILSLIVLNIFYLKKKLYKRKTIQNNTTKYLGFKGYNTYN